MAPSKVAIIILNWNGSDYTLDCLLSLKKLTFLNYKIFLTDNGSSPNDLLKIKDFVGREFNEHQLKLIDNKKNYGFAEGNNIAIRQALAEPGVQYVLLLNNDTIVSPELIERGLAAITGAKQMVAFRIMSMDDPKQVDSCGLELTRGGLSYNRRDFNSLTFCPAGAAALYSRSLLENIKINNDYLDSRYFVYAEDLDLGFRARLKGFDCGCVNEPLIYHKGSATTSIMSRTATFYTYRNILWTLYKNFPNWLWVKYFIHIVVGQLAVIMINIWRKQGKLIIKSYWTAITGMKKMKNDRNKIQKEKSITAKEISNIISPYIFNRYYLKNLFR